jgi:hypothetical protein
MYSFERLLCVPVADSKCPTLHRDMTKVGEGWRQFQGAIVLLA